MIVGVNAVRQQKKHTGSVEVIGMRIKMNVNVWLRIKE